MIDPAFPVDFDAFLATVTRLLIERNKRAAVAAVAFGTAQPIDASYHDFGRDWPAWRISIRLPGDTYARIDPAEREELEGEIRSAANEVTADFEDRVTEVKILPAIEAHPEWRTDAKAFASGNGGVSNQGRVRSDNPAWKSHDGLFFRSQAEVNFYEACKQARLTAGLPPTGKVAAISDRARHDHRARRQRRSDRDRRLRISQRESRAGAGANAGDAHGGRPSMAHRRGGLRDSG